MSNEIVDLPLVRYSTLLNFTIFQCGYGFAERKKIIGNIYESTSLSLVNPSNVPLGERFAGKLG